MSLNHFVDTLQKSWLKIGCQELKSYGPIILDGSTWPSFIGSDGSVISTDGTGNLSFSPLAFLCPIGGVGSLGSPVSVITLPSNVFTLISTNQNTASLLNFCDLDSNGLKISVSSYLYVTISVSFIPNVQADYTLALSKNSNSSLLSSQLITTNIHQDTAASATMSLSTLYPVSGTDVLNIYLRSSVTATNTNITGWNISVIGLRT